MPWTERSKLTALMILHLLWGSALWFSISKYGLGVSTDSVHMLFGGLNFVSGNGLTTHDGTFLVLWPPLYPILLGIVHLVIGWEMLASAAALQAAAFLGLGLFSALLFLRIFPEHFALAVLATVIADIGSVMLIGFGEVGSDYVHLFLVVLCILLTGRYLATSSGRIFVMLAVAGMFAALTRYLGVAAIASGAASIMLLSKGNLRRRVSHSVVLCLTAAPTVIWLAITSQLYTRRDPITLAENFSEFSRSILGWFFTLGTVKNGLDHNVVWLWSSLLLLLVIVLMPIEIQGARRNQAPQPSPPALYLYPLLLYGLLYALALFGSASLAYFNKLSGRFLLPMYLPLVILPIAAVGGILRWAQYKISRPLRVLISGGLVLGLLVMATLLLRITFPLVVDSQANGVAGGGNSLNTQAWRENPAVQYWLSHVPSGPYLLLSNESDGAAFHTQHAAEPSPRRAAGPYGTAEFPLSEYSQQLFESGNDVYLLWIEPSPYDHYYAPEELEAIAAVEPLIVSETGGLYRLKPRGVP